MEGAVEAPIIFLDNVTVFGTGAGHARMTLETFVQIETPTGEITTKGVVVAHLRTSLAALASLQRAVAGIELLVKGPQSSERPN